MLKLHVWLKMLIFDLGEYKKDACHHLIIVALLGVYYKQLSD